MKVVFLGTPDFAIPSLRALLDAGYEVPAVITQPDRPRGRGHKLNPCEVKKYAISKGLNVHSFKRIRDREGVDFLKNLDFDVMVTAAFGQILSQEILDIPKYGCINVHASLLPKYRGPAPIQWAIIKGETETGITTMLTERGVDTGDILMQDKTFIEPEETAGELFDRLAEMGGYTLIKTLKGLELGTITPIPQNHDEATHFPMLKKEDGKIDFHKTAQEVKNLVRGVNPWPGAYVTLGSDVLKIWDVEIVHRTSRRRPGTMVNCDAKNGIVVNTADYEIALKEVQFAGKRRMEATAALCGRELDGTKVFE
jgi:methionyl-tRNA formyltransferase